MDDLINLAYSFFPKKIPFEDKEEYEQTQEFKHLKTCLQKAEALKNNWSEFLNGLIKEKIEFEEIGFDEKLQRCFRIALILHEVERYYLVLNISKLVPYFCFYTKTSLNLKFGNVDYFITYDFNTIELKMIKTIEELIEKYFHLYKEFPVELINIELKDVEYEDLGNLEVNKKYKIIHASMSLYNAFFNSYLFF